MRMPAVLSSVVDGRWQTHLIELPVCCPVSKNPRSGSVLLIRYQPNGLVLEVGALYAYLYQYKGGLRDDQGNILVRDMEGMISLIAEHCSQALGVPVHVRATLMIAPKQVMKLTIQTGKENNR